MKIQLDTRMYTNVILTVISVLLLALCLNVYHVSVTQGAFAQTQGGAKYDTTIPQSQDVAVAAATDRVADANREIADAIKQLAKSVDGIGGSIEKAQSSAPKQ